MSRIAALRAIVISFQSSGPEIEKRTAASCEECKALFAIYQDSGSHIDEPACRDGNAAGRCWRTTMAAARMVYRFSQYCFRAFGWCWDTVPGAAGG
jgi:hypothetical protein